MKKIFTFLTVVVLTTSSSFSQSSIAVGATCPNFTLTDTDGNSHDLYTYCDAGKYVLVDFFAYWCGPCAQTAPIIHDFYEKYGCNAFDVVVIGNESDAGGTLANLETFKANAGITGSSFPNILGSQGGNGNMLQYGISAYPTVVLIGPDRKMINNDIWPIGSVAAIENAFPVGAITANSCASALSLEKLDVTSEMNIYPNPASKKLSVKVKDLNSVSVYDATGRLVHSASFDTTDEIEIDLNNFESGVYSIRVQTNIGVAVKMFTKI